MNFDYYYGLEAEQFSFYRVPKILVKDKRFKKLSSDAKILYGLMLDRMSLSIKNGWIDDENRSYIYYTLDNIMEDLCCAKEKCSKIITELKNIGLIEKKRQGLGKPDIIYVKNFTTIENREEQKTEQEDICHSTIDNFSEVRKSNFKSFENRTSVCSYSELLGVRKSNSNYTDINKTDISYSIESNQYQMVDSVDNVDNFYDKIDTDGDVDKYISLIKNNIEYDYHMKYDLNNKGVYDELFEIICDVVCVPRKAIRIGKEDYPYQLVKSKFLKLNSEHLEYVIECMNNTKTEISNIKQYLITVLYNAPNTMSHYYKQEARSDICAL